MKLECVTCWFLYQKNSKQLPTATIETQFNLKMDFVKAHLLDDKMQLKNRLFINQEVNDNGISFKATSGCFLCGDKIYFGAL